MKKILIVLYYYNPYVSGVSVYAKRLAEELVKNGHKVTVLTTQYKDELHLYESINGVDVVRVPIQLSIGKGVISLGFWFKMVRLSKEFDIVNFHLPMADAGLASLFIPKNKIITTYQCDINLGKGFINKVIEKISYLLMDLALFRSEKIVVLSKDYFEYSHFNKYMSKAVQVYPPIALNDFYYTNFESLLVKLNLNASTFKIGFVGRIVEEKGLQYLINSTEFIKNKLDDFKIIIAGDYTKVAGGSIKEELDIIVKKYPNRVIFTGFLSDEELIKFYSMIDVLVLPSVDPLEAFGMVQVESMACKTPVIATDRPGVREVINKTGYGYLIKPKDSKDIADKVLLIEKNKISIDRNNLMIFDKKVSAIEYEKLF